MSLKTKGGKNVEGENKIFSFNPVWLAFYMREKDSKSTWLS